MRSDRIYGKHKARQEAAEGEKQIGVPRNVRSICNLISVLMLAYALVAGDVPTAMIAFAVVAGTFPASIRIGAVTFGRELQKAMHAFSLTLFGGALILLIFY